MTVKSIAFLQLFPDSVKLIHICKLKCSLSWKTTIIKLTNTIFGPIVFNCLWSRHTDRLARCRWRTIQPKLGYRWKLYVIVNTKYLKRKTTRQHQITHILSIQRVNPQHLSDFNAMICGWLLLFVWLSLILGYNCYYFINSLINVMCKHLQILGAIVRYGS